MSKKYQIKVTSFAELATAYPLAVTEETIPAQTVQKVNYSYVAKLLDCKITVPGIEILTKDIADSVGSTVAIVEQKIAAVSNIPFKSSKL